ncbi:TniB family NTP-binding protein [Pseudomonas sp. NPDC087336]|uniref:TniB family NTP-binding protein n=1 Tax=Pseudomonas sp. NPDC087336 TaxID=3364436 RepID=UPI0038041306
MTHFVSDNNVDDALTALAACTVWYPEYQAALRVINKCIDTTRDRKDPASAMLIGPTGVGKTRLCRMIEKQLGTLHEVTHETCVKMLLPCMYVELPETATVKSLSMVMAKALGQTPNDHQSITSLEWLIIERFMTMEVKLVILDDFHHVAEKGEYKTKKALCNWLMVLMNSSGIPFLVSGASGAEATINMADELSDRFPYRARLELLPLAEEQPKSVLLGVLAGLQHEMIRLGQLKSYPHLTDPNNYKCLYLATQGNFRRLSDLLHDAFRNVLLRGDSIMTIDDFAEAAEYLSFCNNPNYFRMTPNQLNNALKMKAKQLSEQSK